MISGHPHASSHEDDTFFSSLFFLYLALFVPLKGRGPLQTLSTSAQPLIPRFRPASLSSSSHFIDRYLIPSRWSLTLSYHSSHKLELQAVAVHSVSCSGAAASRSICSLSCSAAVQETKRISTFEILCVCVPYYVGVRVRDGCNAAQRATATQKSRRVLKICRAASIQSGVAPLMTWVGH